MLSLRRYLDAVLVCGGVLSLSLLSWPLGDVTPVAAAVPLAVVTCVPWLWRHRHPVLAPTLCGAGLVACIVGLHAFDWASVAAVVLLFLVAFEGDRRRSLVVGAITVIALAGVLIALIPVLQSSDDLSGAGVRVLGALAAIALGELLRSRQALREAERDRARRELEELQASTERQAAAERLQIARELHDTLGHALVAINVRSSVTAHLGASPESAEALNDIKTASAQALADLRATLDVLRDRDLPAPNDPTLGLDALPTLVDRIRSAGLRMDTRLRLDGERIPSVIDHAAFRIIQESLTNVLRHARRASWARIRVEVDNETLDIEITDDGTGAAGANVSGHGLAGMSERAVALGGTVTAGPLPRRGWQVRAKLPLRAVAP